MYKTIFFLTILFLTFISCKKNRNYTPVKVDCVLTKQIDSIKTLIVGEWEWVEGIRNDHGTISYLTPNTECKKLNRKFINDTSFLYENGGLVQKGIYKILPKGAFTNTNFQDDLDPVLAVYDINSGLRISTIPPIRICEKYLCFQLQFVTSTEGVYTWKRK
jgi:hypothetical protein